MSVWSNLSSLALLVHCKLGDFSEKLSHKQEVTLACTLVQSALIGMHPRDSIMEVKAFCIKICDGIQAVSVQNMAGCAKV